MKKIIYIFTVVIFSVVFFLFGFSFHPNVEYKTILEKDKFLPYASEFGFTFNYPNDMFIFRNPEDTSFIAVVPSSFKANKDEPATGVVISVSSNTEKITPLEWLKGPNSSADLSKGYGIVNIDGQEAISLEKGTWIVFDTPNNKLQVSIATLPGENPSQSLQEEMSSIVKSIIFTE
ncbi:MAG: hypothetical protein NTW11_01475 [Candidatus Staskawiczbacteria bacterium]|nr:hypothetical protein [Candidatus Staskawiczbacteria bacterium]